VRSEVAAGDTRQTFSIEIIVDLTIPGRRLSSCEHAWIECTLDLPRLLMVAAHLMVKSIVFGVQTDATSSMLFLRRRPQ
jgi:hypothetical protein